MVTAIRRTDLLRDSIAPFLRFFNGPYDQLNAQPDVANFAVGNPQEMPLGAYVDAIRGQLEPHDKDWFAYKASEPYARDAIVPTLSDMTGLDWNAEDIQMTNGGFAAIALALRTVLDVGDEAIFLSPPWFFYEILTLSAGATPVRVRLAPPRFTIDENALDQAITPRTRLVIVNSPHNPSGRVLTPDELRSLADVLTQASARVGHPIYLLSDEPYRRIVFDGIRYHSPAEFYPHTLVCYSYGKQLLAPGMRIGYLTWPPTMPDRERLREDAFVHQIASGWSFPNADLQRALHELEPMSIDIPRMQQRRDRVITGLRGMGYETTVPEGTFYVMVRSPLDDDEEFGAILNRNKVLLLPGAVVELPGWLRLSLTASDEMIDMALPRFERALAEARQ